MPFHCITRLERLYNTTMRVLLPNIAVAVAIDPLDSYDDIPEPVWLETAVRCGLAQVLYPDAAGQVSLLLTDDAKVRELNRQYRGLDETTDVLSFSAQHGGHWQGDNGDAPDAEGGNADFPMPDYEPPPLGDIAISLPQAARQAEAAGVPLERELALLLVHGALHLLGHDHLDDGAQAAMQRLEQGALAAIFGQAGGE